MGARPDRAPRCLAARVGDEGAQSMIELSLIVPFLILAFLGIVDYSRFMYFQQSISSAARTGADIAMNHCTDHSSCGMVATPTADEFVIQATYCDAAPTVALRPAPVTCASSMTNVTPSSVCGTTCLAGLCVQDICTSPTAATRVNGMDVTVYVGYRFQPITPLISHFLPVLACWPSDPLSNRHTVCARATGNVY